MKNPNTKKEIMNFAEFLISVVSCFLYECTIDYSKRDAYNLKIAPKNSAITIYAASTAHNLEIANILYPSKFEVYIEKLPKYIRLTVNNRTNEAVLQNPNFANIYHHASKEKIYKIYNMLDLLDALRKIEKTFEIELNKINSKNFSVDYDNTKSPVLIKEF